MSHDRKVRFAATYAENEPGLAWLRKEAFEEVIEPELPICDPHHHLFDLRGKVAAPKGGGRHFSPAQIVYMLPEVLEDMFDGHNVVKTVFTQAFAFHLGKGFVP